MWCNRVWRLNQKRSNDTCVNKNVSHGPQEPNWTVLWFYSLLCCHGSVISTLIAFSIFSKGNTWEISHGKCPTVQHVSSWRSKKFSPLVQQLWLHPARGSDPLVYWNVTFHSENEMYCEMPLSLLSLALCTLWAWSVIPANGQLMMTAHRMALMMQY